MQKYQHETRTLHRKNRRRPKADGENPLLAGETDGQGLSTRILLAEK